MSAPIEPTQYQISVYPLGQAGPLVTDQWVTWDSSSPYTVSFVNGLAVKSLWFPDPIGAMSFYAGSDTTGTPFYVTDGSVAELVSIPNDAPVVTISGPGGTLYFYASTFPYTPFASGTPPTLDIGVVAPIVNTGSSSAPVIGLATPLAIAYGGSGTTDPSLVAGSNVTITGSWPNQQIDVSEGAGGVQSVAVAAPITLAGTGQNPIIGLDTPLPLGDGGTATADPYLEGTNGIVVNGADSVEDQTFQWVLSLVAFLLDNAGDTVNGPTQFKETGGISVAKTGAAQITFDTTGLIPVADSSGSSEPGISSVDGSVQVTAYGGQQRVDLSVSIPDALPIRYPNGGNVPGTDPHIVISDPSSPPSVTYSVSGGVVTIGTTHVTLSGSAQFSANNYSVAFSTASATGGSVPVFDLFASNITSSGFDVTGFGNGGSGSGTISFNYIAIGD